MEEEDGMKRWFSVVVAWLLIAAVAGCQQGKQGADTKAPKAEIRAADTKSGRIPKKTASVNTTKAAASKAAAHEAHEATESRGGKAGTLTASDDGREVTLRQGQTVTVVLDSNHSNGFTWAVTSPTAGVIVPSGKGAYAVKSGGRGTETWRFLAMKPGRQTVRLEYRTEWTQNMPERTFRFTAIVK